jgi:transposase-like protein
LPDFLLERRLDEVEVIGQALALGIVGGLGMRSVANRLGVPMTTARDWRRRFQLHAPALAAALVALAVHLDPTAVLLSHDGEAAALEALGAAWQRARTRFGARVPLPTVWRFWSLISGGKALGTNRSPPFRQRSGADWMVLIP